MSMDPNRVFSKSGTIEESGVAGVYTLTLRQPAGSTLVDVGVTAVALWTAGTSATMKVGDATDDDGIFTAVNLKATDLLAGEQISAAGAAGTAGGKVGSDIAANQWNRRYSATARDIKFIVTTVGTAASAGRTLCWINYILPYTGQTIKATKV